MEKVNSTSKIADWMREQLIVLHSVNLAILEASKKGWIMDWTVNKNIARVSMSGDRTFVRYAMSTTGDWELCALSFDDWQPVYKQVSPEQAADMIQTKTPEQILEWLKAEGEVA